MTTDSPAYSPTRRVRSRKLTRAEKSQATLRALFRAAIETVGRYGYEGASITRITERAQVAQGTFYNYFQSRQQLFDRLLPTLGTEMLDFIRAEIEGETDIEERERRSFNAFFAFVKKEPHFFRILYEAETFAPKAYREHMKRITQSYTRTLLRQRESGMHSEYDARELEVIVHVLIAARAALAIPYVFGPRNNGKMPTWVTRAFVKFAMHGLKGVQRP